MSVKGRKEYKIASDIDQILQKSKWSTEDAEVLDGVWCAQLEDAVRHLPDVPGMDESWCPSTSAMLKSVVLWFTSRLTVLEGRVASLENEVTTATSMNFDATAMKGTYDAKLLGENVDIKNKVANAIALHRADAVKAIAHAVKETIQMAYSGGMSSSEYFNSDCFIALRKALHDAARFKHRFQTERFYQEYDQLSRKIWRNCRNKMNQRKQRKKDKSVGSQGDGQDHEESQPDQRQKDGSDDDVGEKEDGNGDDATDGAADRNANTKNPSAQSSDEQSRSKRNDEAVVEETAPSAHGERVARKDGNWSRNNNSLTPRTPVSEMRRQLTLRTPSQNSNQDKALQRRRRHSESDDYEEEEEDEDSDKENQSSKKTSTGEEAKTRMLGKPPASAIATRVWKKKK